MGKVIATCTSEIKGVQKKNVHQVCLIEDYGIEGDAHAGKWHRQVSLLSYDRIQEFRARGAKVEDGAFGENLVVEGIDFKTLPIGTKFKCNDVVLELTQIGKECHHGCAIFQAMGDCIMPREGVRDTIWQEKNFFMALAATGQTGTDARIKEDASNHSVWFNMASDKSQSEFYFPANAQGRELTAGLISGGADPGLTHRVAKEVRRVLAEAEVEDT